MPYPDKIEGIKVDRKAGHIYFLYATAWGILNKVETAFAYVVHYGDGTVEELPVRNFRFEISDEPPPPLPPPPPTEPDINLDTAPDDIDLSLD